MDAQATEEILRFFRDIRDPRAANARHPLSNVLSIAILAVLCGSEGWAAVEAWGWGNIQWLATFLNLPHGIPSHDTFDRVFGLLDPLAFEREFQAFTQRLIEGSDGRFVAVDGKTLRRSWKHAWSKSPVHLVSAFVSQNQTVLGQLAVDGKGNEITAIPKLLAMLCLKGRTVTIDAIGCQREIARQILDQEGDYILALKDNQPTLYGKAQRLLDDAILSGFEGMSHGYCEHPPEKNSHGRVERRRVWVTDEVHWLGQEILSQWPGLASLAVVESERQDLGNLEGRVSRERRYFISSHRGTDARQMAQGIRGHWGIENGLHWRLDVQMNEDQCRLRKDHGAENFSRLRRIALNKLKRWQIKKPNGKVLKVGMRIKQQACGWSREYLLQALFA